MQPYLDLVTQVLEQGERKPSRTGGGLGPGAEIVEASGVFAVVQPIVDRPTDLETAMADTERLLANAAARLARGIGIGRRLGTRGWR